MEFENLYDVIVRGRTCFQKKFSETVITFLVCMGPIPTETIITISEKTSRTNPSLAPFLVRHTKVERRCSDVALTKIMVLKGDVRRRRNPAFKAIREQELISAVRLALLSPEEPK